GPVSEKPDESLFFVDTGDEEKDRKQNRAKEKPLKVDLILQIDSKVPAPKDILAHQVPNARKLKRKQQLWEKLAEKGVVPRKERLLQERLRKAPAEKTSSLGPGSATSPSRAFYDIWSDSNPLDQVLAGKDTWFLEQTKKKPVKRPGRLLKTPSQLPAVEVIAPGGSYNPSFQAHQALLLQAHEVELKRKDLPIGGQCGAATGVWSSAGWPKPAGCQKPRLETVFREQCEGLLEEDNSGDEEEHGEPSKPEKEALQAGSGPAPPLTPAAVVEKKTERQRKKEKEAKRLVPRPGSGLAAEHGTGGVLEDAEGPLAPALATALRAALQKQPQRLGQPPGPPAKRARELSEKAARLRRQEVFQLRSIGLQVKRREAELLRRRR
ncbi:PREDICTED: glioma tumor suppressor candidate region gene 2 protein, partial [Gekko japonicus]|uniref:Ribosome biogenesis protein NOP53 n=1 Tax=Gekko japonicus TaxID=146911 RepID=A0ABM1KJC3_GEKJA